MSRLLLVEDQNAFIVEQLLKAYRPDYQITVAKSGTVAMRWLYRESFDLVLLDLRLPGLSGFEVLEGLRKIDSCLPVIVMTAYGDKKTRERCRNLGAMGFMAKPLDFARLTRMIEVLLAQHQPHQPHLPQVDRQAEQQNKWRRLNKLRERAAAMGLETPPAVLIEIEDLERELNGNHRSD